MTVLVRGQKLALDPADVASELYVGVRFPLPGGQAADPGCFGLDPQGRLGDDRYLVFYNQPDSPEGAVRLTPGRDGDGDGFLLRLDTLPAAVDRLVVTVAVDPPTTMSALSEGGLRLVAGGRELARFPLRGGDFSTERAVILAELYRHHGWRLAAVGQGVEGGLAELVTSFGGSLHGDDAGAPQAGPAPAGVAAQHEAAQPTAAEWGTPLPVTRPGSDRSAWGTPVAG